MKPKPIFVMRRTNKGEIFIYSLNSQNKNSFKKNCARFG